MGLAAARLMAAKPKPADAPKADPPKVRWYRRKTDGQLGFMVEVDGKEVIRLDRPSEPGAVERFSDQRWEPVSVDRPVNRSQVARIAFAADRALCLMLALHGEARKEWVGLSDKERIAFVQGGPPADPPLRRELYQAIVALFPNQVA